jgi:hypothetical protein
MSFDFAINALEKLKTGPLGPWIDFALQTAPSAALLAFSLVLALAILISALLWCAGDPKRMLRTALLAAPIAGLYFAVIVGGVMALFGWPILWLFTKILGLSPDVEAWASSNIKLNYLSIGMVVGTAIAILIALLVHGIWTEQRKIQFARTSTHSNKYGGGRTADGEHSTIVEGRELFKPHVHGRLSQDYRRIGVTVGVIFAAVPIAAWLFAGMSFSLLIYCGFASVIMFAIPYGISRSVGWITDSFLYSMQAETSKDLVSSPHIVRLENEQAPAQSRHKQPD